MHLTSNSPSAAPWYYAAAVVLMFAGVAFAFVQKVRENAVKVTVAKRAASGHPETEESRKEVRQIIRAANHWAIASLAAVFLAIVSWTIALWRCEKRGGTWAIILSLFALYCGLQLLIV